MSLVSQMTAILNGADGTWAVVLTDAQRVADGMPRYARNADLALPAASLIKIALGWQLLSEPRPIGGCVVRDADICDKDGSLAAQVGQEITWHELGQRMIVESENNATNLLLDRLGGIDAANRWLAAAGYRQTRWGRRMLDFAARAAGRDNLASASEIAAMLGRIDRLSRTREAAASQLVKWMRAADSQGKLEAGLPPGTPLAHKTGDLPDVEHDAGIVSAPDGSRYVLVVMAANIADATAARATIAAISRVCWESR